MMEFFKKAPNPGLFSYHTDKLRTVFPAYYHISQVLLKKISGKKFYASGNIYFIPKNSHNESAVLAVYCDCFYMTISLLMTL